MAMRQWDGGPKAVKADGGGGFLGGAIAGFTGGVATLSLEQFKEEQQRETARIQNEALKLMKDEEYKRSRQDKITDRDEEREYQAGLLASQAEAADAQDLIKRERDLEKYRSEKEIDADISEAKAIGDHERAMELAELKEMWQAQYNPTGGDKAKKEDLKGLRAARLFEFAQTLAPEFATSFEADPEKADWKSIANELRKQGRTEEAKKIAEYNSALEAATTAEEIQKVFEQFNKPADDDPLGLL